MYSSSDRVISVACHSGDILVDRSMPAAKPGTFWAVGIVITGVHTDNACDNRTEDWKKVANVSRQLASYCLPHSFYFKEWQAARQKEV
jgi:hypothetical protein